MVGKCPHNPKTLKGGVTCIDGAGHHCFCNKNGCTCGDYTGDNILGSRAEDAKNLDARREWCANHDPQGKYNQFCADYGPGIPYGKSAAQLGGDTIISAADKAGLNWDNLTLIGLGGLALVMLVVMIR